MTNSIKNTPYLKSKLNAVLLAGFIAGTLDIIAAFASTSIILQKFAAEQVLRFIASGVFGNSAFSGGVQMIFFGLIFHYIIAFGFTIIYFLLYQNLHAIKTNKILIGAAYGLIVWLIMNLIVVPLSQTPELVFSWDRTLKGIVILIFCVGIPIAAIADKFYKNKNYS